MKKGTDNFCLEHQNMEPIELLTVEDFCWHIRDIRKKYGVTQEYVGANSGIKRQNLGRIELEQVGDIRLSTVIHLANALNMSLYLKFEEKDLEELSVRVNATKD